MKTATNKDELIQAAINYRNDHNFPVIPVNVTTDRKVPYIKWKEYQRGLPEEEQIRNWWSEWPNAALGIVRRVRAYGLHTVAYGSPCSAGASTVLFL